MKGYNRITQPAELNWEILMSRQLGIRCINVCGKMVTGYKTEVTTVNVTQGDGDIIQKQVVLTRGLTFG